MRRSLATAAALGFTWLALPAAPAHACSLPRPWFDTSREAVVAGDPLGVSGEAVSGRCPVFTMPPPSETPSETAPPSETPSETVPPSETPAPTQSVSPSETPVPTQSVSPSETPVPTQSTSTTPAPAPGGDSGEQAFRPEAAMRVAQVPGRVAIYLIAEDDADDPVAPRQLIGTVPEERTVSGSGTSRSFDGTVTVPSSTSAGRYVVEARSDITYGQRPLVVGGSIPATGAPTSSMLKVALMFGVSGVVAVAGGVAMARRAPAPVG